jgi:hypothetical protein
MLKEAYEEEDTLRACAFWRFKWFSEVNLEQVRILMWNNQRHTLRIIAQELNMNRETF